MKVWGGDVLKTVNCRKGFSRMACLTVLPGSSMKTKTILKVNSRRIKRLVSEKCFIPMGLVMRVNGKRIKSMVRGRSSQQMERPKRAYGKMINISGNILKN